MLGMLSLLLLLPPLLGHLVAYSTSPSCAAKRRTLSGVPYLPCSLRLQVLGPVTMTLYFHTDNAHIRVMLAKVGWRLLVLAARQHKS